MVKVIHQILDWLDSKAASAIILPETTKQQLQQVTAFASGSGYIVRSAIGVKTGDVALSARHTGAEI
jgi:co-chaperonin GroES (HSP10)